MKQLLEDTDELLAHLEDFVHGYEGKAISIIRGQISRAIKELNTPKKLKIELNDYYYKCGDGCCDNYGLITTINGEELPCHNTDVYTVLEQALKHLGYEVEMSQLNNGKEI